MWMVEGQAWCVDCNWKTQGKNSQGNGAKHSQKTGHKVQGEACFGFAFGYPPRDDSGEQNIKKEE